MEDRKIKIHFISFGILAAVAVWYAAAQFFLVPKNEMSLNSSVKTGSKVLANCEKIYDLDPARLKFSEARKEVGKFQYTTVVDKLARTHGIGPSDYDIRTEAVIKRSNRQTQGATMVIKTVDMMSLTSFINEFLETWPGLEIDTLDLRSNDAEDDWKATLRFTYTVK